MLSSHVPAKRAAHIRRPTLASLSAQETRNSEIRPQHSTHTHSNLRRLSNGVPVRADKVQKKNISTGLKSGLHQGLRTGDRNHPSGRSAEDISRLSVGANEVSPVTLRHLPHNIPLPSWNTCPRSFWSPLLEIGHGHPSANSMGLSVGGRT